MTRPAHSGDADGGLPVVGVSLGHRDHAAAEHWLATLRPAPVMACTHLLTQPHPHVAVSLAGPPDALPAMGEDAYRVAADAAAAAHRARHSGRAVLFPGVERLTGVLSVAEIIARSAIERIHVLGSGDAPDPDAPVETREHVRPQWMGGALTLVTVPGAGGRLTPFEVASPTPCCAAH